MKSVLEAAPLVSIAILFAVFANAFYYQIAAIPQFVFVLRQWGIFAEDVELRRAVARGVLAFEFLILVGLLTAFATGVIQSRRSGNFGWRLGQISLKAVLLYLQLTIILYAAVDPLLCGCGPLAVRIDGWIDEAWYALNLPAPKTAGAISIVRNVLLSFVAAVGLSRGEVKKMDED